MKNKKDEELEDFIEDDLIEIEEVEENIDSKKIKKKRKKLTKGAKAGIALGIIFVIFASLLIYYQPKRSRDLTEEEHLQRIEKAIQARYIDGGSFYYDYRTRTEPYDKPIACKVTDFELYPLYNVNDEMRFVLVEFEPIGFTYVKIWDSGPLEFHSDKSPIVSMYNLCGNNVHWSFCHFDPNDKEKIIVEDEVYARSPYFVNNIKNEKRYLVEYMEEYTIHCLPCVKRGDKYLNLYSNQTFSVIDGKADQKQAFIRDIYFIPKMGYNLWVPTK